MYSVFISPVCRYAASVNDGSQYFVLLIITDGVISDMAQTKESIVNVRTTTTAKQCSHFGEDHIHGKPCICRLNRNLTFKSIGPDLNQSDL